MTRAPFGGGSQRYSCAWDSATTLSLSLITDEQGTALPSTMCAHRLAVDMMDNASALPTCPQDNNNGSRQIKIGLKSPTRLHDEAKKLTGPTAVTPLTSIVWTSSRSGSASLPFPGGAKAGRRRFRNSELQRMRRGLAEKTGAEWVAWGTVQKISNLILNLNLFMEDVQTGRIEFAYA